MGIDSDLLEHATSTPSVPHEIHLGSDQMDGGDGNDRLIGDDLVVISSPTLGLPVKSSTFLETATELQSYLFDLQTVAKDLENVVFEAHYQVLGQLLQAGATPAPNLHDLHVGNDTVNGAAGADAIAGDQAIVVMPVISGVRFDLIRDSSPIDATTWNAVETALHNSTTSHNAALNAHVSGNHDRAHRTLSPAQQNALPPDYDYELFVGNDTLMGGDDRDLVVGDFAVDALPISLKLPANDQQLLLLRQDVRELMDDMELFLETRHHTNDTVPIQQRYTHAHYDERRGAAQEVALHAGSDSIDGGQGADFVLADSDSAAVTNQVESPDQRDLEVDPEWKVEYLNRMFFELTAHYKRDSAVSDINEDQVTGGDGDDLLFGQWNDDTLQGNAGDDLVFGGSGQNTVSGGPGTNDVRSGSEDTPSKTELDNMKDRVFVAQSPSFNALIRDVAAAPTQTRSELELNPITGSLHGASVTATSVPLGTHELASRIGGGMASR